MRGTGQRRPASNGKRRVRHWSRRRSIGAYLSILVAVQALLFAGFITMGIGGNYRDAHRAAEARAESGAQQASDVISHSLAQAKSVMAYEAALSGYETVFKYPNSCSLTADGSDAFTKGELSIITPNGAVACTSLRSSGGIPGRGYGGSPWLQQLPKAKEPLVVGPVNDPVTGFRALLVAVPISGTPGGIVLSLRLDVLGAGLATRLSIGPMAPGFLVVSGDRTSEITRSFDGKPYTSLKGTRFSAPIARGAQFQGPDGVDGIYAEAVVPSLGWRVLARLTSEDAFSGAKRSAGQLIAIGGLIILASLMVALFVNRRLVKPVRSLSKSVDVAVEGDLTTHVSTDGPREIARLAERFKALLKIRARAEDALRTAYETEVAASDRLRELDRMRNAFLLAISHELRTPLTSVVGYSTLLDEQEDLSDAETKHSIHAIATQSKRLERLLLDLLDIERLSRGAIEARRAPTDVFDLVDRVLEFSTAGDRLTVEVEYGLVCDIDPALTERIVENLIVNAVKHTPPQTPIWLTVSSTKSEMLIVVEDAGEGVPDKLKKTIFEPFEQGKVPEHSPGTGIGLTLVMQFARLHGGRAWVSDRRGGGASFHVALPASRRKVAANAAA